MVTENCRLAEVTEAAERMGGHSAALARKQNFNHKRTQVFEEEKHRGNTFCGFSLFASVLSVVRILSLSCRLNPASSPPAH